MSSPRVVAVVVTWNRLALLQESLAAVRGQTHAPAAIVVVDNDSTDGTRELLDSSYAADLWYGETVAMTFGGAFLLPDTDDTVDFSWGATYAPRHERAASDFGGNALVATAGTERPEAAAAFLDHLTRRQPMLDFCEP